MKAKVAINGFGRIGRMAFRRAFFNENIEIVAVNATHPPKTLAHLLKYDSTHGTFDVAVDTTDDALIVDGKEIKLLQNRDPKQLPWAELGVDIVIEATGKFVTKEGAGKHIEAGAKKVVITAPAKEEDITIVMGVNEEEYDHDNHHVISNASCTTNCLAPVVKTLDDVFGIQSGMMTTVHAYTNDQKNIDNPHKDLRRARSCGQSIIPTTTGAARAISLVLPHLDGKLNGMALRIPTPNVSLVDLVCELQSDVTAEQVNEVFKSAEEKEMKGILGVSDEPLVSIDFNGDDRSSIVDSMSTMVMNKRQVKVIAWYDNEWGYACRVIDLVDLIAQKITQQSVANS
ncbi:glyceraldehyde-3-phosphate dehydrogenase [Geomicrobium sp. JCM 19038]|uniref:glyceraldehyde-3-phosphate dehydrogenase n=1 Tax=Geomicrobium sp. JCM 19038 TaxID=1460635 RepID=UPI00045F4B6C|nr:glyceraldehyde-3-phosphate dehydrogenase [Geomicrobium sp. JCM 19038]GAK09708.1 NAD-dependent glyceraldehyde-3-phosphate dehydrogenase [Geomicrobium sp. JCM 19038]